jgi:glycogen synthase
LKITLVTTGGITRFFRNWPELLLAKALVQRGHQVSAYTYWDEHSEFISDRDEEIEGVRVRRVRPSGWYSRELGRLLAQEDRPDVLHIFHIRNYLAFQAAWSLGRKGVPYVVSPIGPLHDPYLVADRDRPLDAPARLDNLVLTRRALLSRVARDAHVKRHLENYLMHWPLHNANAVIPCSEHERRLWGQIGIAGETIPLWIDEPFISAHAGARYPVDFGRPVILFVAQLKYRKGFDVLADSIPYVTRRFPQATFVFVSHSPIHRAKLEQIARENGTLANLKIVERATEEEKIALYRLADAFAFPTRYEGFGLPLLEAMAAGCPVVSTRIPVVDEIVCDGQNGLLVPRDDPAALANAILRLLQEKGLRERLVAQGYATLPRFSEGPLVARVEATYGRVSGFAQH